MKINAAALSGDSMKSLALLAAVAVAVFARASPALAQAQTSLEAPRGPDACLPEGDIRFICGRAAVEDIIYLPGEDWVLADARRGEEGGLRIVSVKEKRYSTIFPSPTARERFDRTTYPTCPGPLNDADKAKFVSHGLALTPRGDGQFWLYVVHHGTRESVEVFDFDARGATPSVTWVGCAVAPEPIGLNSVVGLPEGGFIATNFRNREPAAPPAGQASASGAPAANTMAAMRAGAKNGELWEWHTASGWAKVPGSDSSGANGVEISKDGKTIYVAEWGSQSFTRLSRGVHPPVSTSIPLGFRIDNIHWAEDGTLIGAGQYQELDGTKVVKIHPDTLKVTTIFDKPRTESFVPASVAAEVGDELWIGLSIGSNRMAVVPRPK